MKIAKWNEQTQTLYDIREFGSLKAGNGVPLKDWPSYAVRGYFEYVPVELADGEGLDNPTYAFDGGVIRQGGAIIGAIEMQARAEAQAAAESAQAVEDEADRQAAKQTELKAIENLFMILCSAIELQQDITAANKLGFQVLPAHLAQAQDNPEYLQGVLGILNAYAAVFAAMHITMPTDLDGIKELAAYINSAGVYYNVRWWDDCVFHPEMMGGGE